MSRDCEHVWDQVYYGYECRECALFIPFGLEPWLPLDEDEQEELELDEAD